MAKKKRDYDAIKATVEKLTAKVKAKTATPEERIELEEAREILRRHNATERIKAAKAAIKAGKREALFKVLDANGVKTENQLKEIFRFVKEARPELLPVAADAPTPETATEEKDDGETGDAPDPDPEPERNNDKKPEDAPKCENCGAVLIEKMSKNGKRFLGCPNWRPGETHTSKDL